MALRVKPTLFSLPRNMQYACRLNGSLSLLPNFRQKHYLAASSETFRSRLKAHDGKLVIVDFYADWCGPCRLLSPSLERVTSDTKYSNGKEVDLVTINTDEEGELAAEYQIRGLPTVIAFRDGKEVDKFVGAQPPNVVEGWIKQLSI